MTNCPACPVCGSDQLRKHLGGGFECNCSALIIPKDATGEGCAGEKCHRCRSNSRRPVVRHSTLDSSSHAILVTHCANCGIYTAIPTDYLEK